MSLSQAKAVADHASGTVHAMVEIAAPPERVFRALASQEIVDWWVRPGVFDTREWSGDVRVGGRWQASGMARGEPYALEGEFLEVDPPRKLVHTWQRVGFPVAPTTVTYRLEPIAGGTRLTLTQSGFTVPAMMEDFSTGWDTSFARLVELLAAKQAAHAS